MCDSVDIQRKKQSSLTRSGVLMQTQKSLSQETDAMGLTDRRGLGWGGEERKAVDSEERVGHGQSDKANGEEEDERRGWAGETSIEVEELESRKEGWEREVTRKTGEKPEIERNSPGACRSARQPNPA